VIRLYTGELGAAGSGAETYLGMMRMNVEALAKALGR
jgi:ABC-type Zn uptake system ZnuABC Zn-binding protein ZnuA